MLRIISGCENRSAALVMPDPPTLICTAYCGGMRSDAAPRPVKVLRFADRLTACAPMGIRPIRASYRAATAYKRAD